MTIFIGRLAISKNQILGQEKDIFNFSFVLVCSTNVNSILILGDYYHKLDMMNKTLITYRVWMLIFIHHITGIIIMFFYRLSRSLLLIEKQRTKVYVFLKGYFHIFFANVLKNPQFKVIEKKFSKGKSKVLFNKIIIVQG